MDVAWLRKRNKCAAYHNIIKVIALSDGVIKYNRGDREQYLHKTQVAGMEFSAAPEPLI